MASFDTSALLRPGLLRGVSILVARSAQGAAPHGAADSSASARASTLSRASAPSRAVEPGAAIAQHCANLGANVTACELAQEHALEPAVRAALAQQSAIDMLVLDAASVFARVAGEPDAGEEPRIAADSTHADRAVGDHVHARGRAALDSCMQVTWEVTRAVASAAFLERQRPGRVVYVAHCDDREHAQEQLYARAARAALENLARTLSIEFSRHAVTTVAIAPGARTSAQEVAALVAYLASPAGAYFSGCLLDLTGPTPASRASERAR